MKYVKPITHLLTSPITTNGQSIYCGMNTGDDVMTGGAMPLPKAT